ncbi:MAG: CoB--CoM heterodisulfide reductase subunit C, partial [Methanobrevibacter sp.]|nr:CoB--CoM heterodisulfide reductase subunit C [Methanobrevibacter sp.]
MSIINRLKSLFVGEKAMEEKDVAGKSDVEEKSSNFDDTIVSGTKTSVPISDVVKKEEPEDDSSAIEAESVEEDLPIIEEDEPSKEEVPEAEEEEPEIEEVPEAEEDENTDDEEELAEKADDEKENKDKKRDNMTLLTDKELLTDANRDPEFTAEFIDAGIETVKHCFQCGTC